MTTRNNTMKSWSDYQDKLQEIDRVAATWDKKKIRKFLIGHLLKTGSILVAACALAAFMVHAYIHDWSAWWGALSVLLTASLFVPLIPIMRHSFESMDQFQNVGGRKSRAYSTFLKALSEELKESGLQVLSVHTEERYIATNRGNVTVVTSKETGAPQVLLNGEMFQHNYLSDTREAVDSHGQIVTVPDRTTAL